MARRQAVRLVLLLAVAAGAPRLAAQGQSAVEAAKDAYASAEYDRCVTLLQSASIPDSEVVVAGEYRALCLVALDREADASTAIEEILHVQPLYRAPASASPRLRTLVMRVKKTVLPEIVQERYAVAKKAYDNKDMKEAAAGFRTVLALLDDPEFDSAAASSLSGMKTVASGFLDLITASASPPPPTPPAPSTPKPPRIYTAGEPGITPPEVIDQALPVWRPDASFVRASITLRGTVEVIIDQSGLVESARLIGKIHPEYDTRLLRAARAWTYRPARQQDGTPVKFRKVIEVTLKPS